MHIALQTNGRLKDQTSELRLDFSTQRAQYGDVNYLLKCATELIIDPAFIKQIRHVEDLTFEQVKAREQCVRDKGHLAGASAILLDENVHVSTERSTTTQR